MKKTDSVEIKISVNNARNLANNNKLVRIAYLIMSAVYLCHVVFFGISAGYIATFYGGLMSSVFVAGYFCLENMCRGFWAALNPLLCEQSRAHLLETPCQHLPKIQYICFRCQSELRQDRIIRQFSLCK